MIRSRWFVREIAQRNWKDLITQRKILPSEKKKSYPWGRTVREADATYHWRMEQFRDLRERFGSIPLDELARLLQFEDITELHQFLLAVPKKYFEVEWNVLRFKKGWSSQKIAFVAVVSLVMIMAVFMIIFSMGGFI